ncbi:hypothetical protein F5879DRAFT_996599 [Lentinula edodes]|nr:hypothetical protein F5879DRAFT_996599 [Lentinula edodes]
MSSRSRGLNARRFTLPDSSEPNLRKAFINDGASSKNVPSVVSETEPVRLIMNPGRDRHGIDTWKIIRAILWSSVATILRRLNILDNMRATFLITLPLVFSYLAREYFPSVHMPKKLIGLSCATMGIVCSCALPELFAPLSAINCNADYYHSLCVGSPRGSSDVHYPVYTTTVCPPVSQAEKDLSVHPPEPLSSFPLVDFGLAIRGAEVFPALTSATEELGSLSYMAGLLAILRGYDKTQIHINPPRVVLEEQHSDCWKFLGSQGHITVALSDIILWTNFTIHFPDSLEITERLRQAPKVLVMRALVEIENIAVEARSSC